MHDGIGVGEYLVEQRPIENRTNTELDGARDGVEVGRQSGRAVVDDYYLVIVSGQFARQIGADESGTAGDNYLHESTGLGLHNPRRTRGDNVAGIDDQGSEARHPAPFDVLVIRHHDDRIEATEVVVR